MARIAWNKGKKFSDETKLKMRNSKLGKKQSKEQIKNRVKSRQGYKHSAETKTKIGAKNSVILKAKNLVGEKCRFWKGGRTKEQISWSKNKRNRLRGAITKELGGHTFGEWELLKKQYNYTCPCCKLSEPFDQKSKFLTQDHIIPLSKGGSDLIENIQPLCLRCNLKKHTLTTKY